MSIYDVHGNVIAVDGGGSENGIGTIAKKIFSGEIKQILLLGDSITAGAGGTGYNAGATGNGYDNTGYCWANVFKKYMLDTYGITVRNFAKYGSIASEQYNIYLNNVQDADDLVIWLSGTNNRTSGRFADYSANIGTYVSAIKAEKELIMISCISASQSNDESADHTTLEVGQELFMACKARGANFISGYNLISEYCDIHGITIADLLADVAHPNDLGHKVLFKQFCYAMQIPLPPYIDFSQGVYYP
jgi:lysophospholipase L1-like esterase